MDLSTKDRYINAAKILGWLRIIVFIIPIFVLIEWTFNMAVLKSFYSGYKSMSPTAAVLFIFSGTALFFVKNEGASKNINIARSIGVLIALVSLINVFAFKWEYNIKIDESLFGATLAGSMMTPNTALNFLLIGFSFIAIDHANHRKYVPTQFLAMAALAVAIYSIVGFLLGAVKLYYFIVFTPTTLFAAINFIGLTLAILLMRYKYGFVRVVCRKNEGGAILRKVLPVCILVPFAVVWLRIKAVSYNWVTLELGSALTVVIIISIFSMLMWRLATSLNKTDARRKTADARLQSILDNAPSMIYVKDLKGRYQLVNNKFKDFFKLQTESIIGKTDFDFEDLKRAEVFKKSDELIIENGKPVEIEDEMEQRGTKFNLLITKFPLLDDDCNVYGVSGIATDITERVKHTEQLVAAKLIAEEAEKMQEQFLANMSHEIRTPMNGILGMTTLLLDTQLTPEQKDFTKTIKQSSDNLIVVINDILDFSKIRAGKLTIEEINFSVAEVLEHLSRIFKHRIAQKKLSFEIIKEVNAPDVLKGDPHRLSQVLINLVGNAIKFTSAGSIKLSVSTTLVQGSQIYLTFSITDSGIGVAENKLDAIFESFQQGSNDISRKYGGTGLGLAITKQLVELQNGYINVASELGVGTTFTVTIPYEEVKHSTAVLFKAKNFDSHASILQDKKILVVEDNEVNQKVIMKVLEKGGGQVTLACNGQKAIDILKLFPDYHLIIMDLQMPEMDGYAAATYIRTVLKLTTPIIAMTASALKGEKEKCLMIGMNDYITKPFDFAFIYESINILLGGNTQLCNQEQVSEVLPSPFKLTLLEEMEDDEYTIEILNQFINATPGELATMQELHSAEDYESIHNLAHKLKSSVGLLQAQELLTNLIDIEADSKNGVSDNLGGLIQTAVDNYKKLETPLKIQMEVMRKSFAKA